MFKKLNDRQVRVERALGNTRINYYRNLTQNLRDIKVQRQIYDEEKERLLKNGVPIGEKSQANCKVDGKNSLDTGLPPKKKQKIRAKSAANPRYKSPAKEPDIFAH